jgi:phosphoglycolate phosphatase
MNGLFFSPSISEPPGWQGRLMNIAHHSAMVKLQCGDGLKTGLEGDRVLPDVGGIVWDKDGTLADSFPFLLELAQRRANRIEKQVPGLRAALLTAWGANGALDPTGLMAVGTRHDNEIAAAAYLAAQGCGWVAALALVREAFVAADQAVTSKASLTPPFPGIASLLETCHGLGLPMAVISGDTTAHVAEFLQQYGLDRWMTWSRGSNRDLAKPDPALFHQVCDRLNVPPSEVWVIGDSELDGVLARQGGAAGWISVTWGGSPPAATADAVVDQVSQLAVCPD